MTTLPANRKSARSAVPYRRRKQWSGLSWAHGALAAALLLFATGPASAQAADWIISETASPVDYSRQVSATLLSLASPEEREMSFAMHCRQGKTELVLGVPDFARYPAGTALDLEFLPLTQEAMRDQTVERRWVRHRGQERRWNELGGTTEVSLRGDAVSFLKQLPDGGRLFVRVKDKRDDLHEAEFDLAGFGPVREKLASACDWPA
ncbi:hypothetical protein JL100_018420 [Skermanella mucosa]|uniref:hypothetical protein n=1 Tax=Skermanella mucosa TaxID=1789672 RepID=UPI00192C12B5|nr:hypothetical protein [Skermanella mucosa]UEM19062.1 hypothetical protein JL100_018420 [Skermanella mucosa]